MTVVGFKDGPLAGEMRKFKTVVDRGLLYVDEGIYEVADVGLPMAHATYVGPNESVRSQDLESDRANPSLG